jgi:hypothetical protein
LACVIGISKLAGLGAGGVVEEAVDRGSGEVLYLMVVEVAVFLGAVVITVAAGTWQGFTVATLALAATASALNDPSAASSGGTLTNTGFNIAFATIIAAILMAGAVVVRLLSPPKKTKQ